MPFTLSHPAAALLFRGTPLPVASLVAGSMVPDVPMFVRIPGSYQVTHSLLGVVSVDLALGVAAVALWCLFLRDALVDVAPGPVRERLDARARYSSAAWALVPLGVVLGSLSHVAWDAFTHPNRWGVRQVDWLHETHGGLAGSAWAQYVSGALGLLVVVAWAGVVVRRLEREPRPPRVPQLGVQALGVTLLGVAGIGAVAALGAVPRGLHAIAFQGAVVGTIALTLGLCALAGTWHACTLSRTRSGI